MATDDKPELTFIRFRIAEDERARAEGVCLEHGIDLHDLLRAVVRRIALEKTIPEDFRPRGQPQRESVPFVGGTPFLARDVAHLRAERVFGLLAEFIAQRSREIAEERDKREPDAQQLDQWSKELRAAVKYHRTLDPDDADLVGSVDERFRLLLGKSS